MFLYRSACAKRIRVVHGSPEFMMSIKCLRIRASRIMRSLVLWPGTLSFAACKEGLIVEQSACEKALQTRVFGYYGKDAVAKAKEDEI